MGKIETADFRSNPEGLASPASTAAVREIDGRKNVRELSIGVLVEVRSAEEIQATLDADGRLDGVPFMPEMIRFCGVRMRVYRRAEKTCVEGHGLRRMHSTVLLENARCDGGRHDGCQRNCMFFWKEAWLRPVEESAPATRADPRREASAQLRLLSYPTRQDDRYVCQSTVLAGATEVLPRWDLRHLATDVARGQLTAAGLVGIIWRTVVNRLRASFDLPEIGALVGTAVRNANGALGLQPGERVRVKSADEIQQTLGPAGKNFGLSFEPEMSRYINGVFEVDFPVRKIILEETGQMVRLKDTVALKTLVCKGSCVKNCPRSNTLYWREAWLERVPSAPAE